MPKHEEPHINGVPLREYVEALFEESKRQRDTADTEREKAASALRDQQNMAMAQAEREREKAADALRENLDRAIREGDDRLREHISNQVMQINAALESAEKLETTRMEAAKEATAALRREMVLTTGAAKEAIIKAEDAQKDVNMKSNEFRGQLSDQAATLMPRRESESRSAELDRRIEEARTERSHQIDGLSGRIGALERGESGVRASNDATRRQQDRIQPWTLWAAGVVFTVVITLVVLLANGVGPN